MAHVRDVYRALYSETGANYQELYDALRSVVAAAAGRHSPDRQPRRGTEPNWRAWCSKPCGPSWSTGRSRPTPSGGGRGRTC